MAQLLPEGLPQGKSYPQEERNSGTLCQEFINSKISKLVFGQSYSDRKAQLIGSN